MSSEILVHHKVSKARSNKKRFKPRIFTAEDADFAEKNWWTKCNYLFFLEVLELSFIPYADDDVE